MELGLKGRTALVTGASSGIGYGIALRLASEGVRLAVMARRCNLLEELSAAITSKGGTKPIIIECNALDEDAADRVAKQALQGLGSVDILVNNAGGSRAFTLENGDGDWSEAITLNFTRPRQLAHRLVNQMMERKWGRIINITGKSEPEGLNGAFSAKAGMHAWAKGLSREVGKASVTVNCIAPGRIISEQILRNYSPEYRKWQSEHEIDVGEYGQPEDIANLVGFLASPLARYITGTVIPVDGGLRRYAF